MEQRKYPLMDEWIYILCSIYYIEYDSAIRKKEICNNMDETKGVMLSEIS